MDPSTKDFLAGTLGGFVGKIVEYPMDTVKVLLQTQDHKMPKYSSAFDCIRQVVNNGGMKSLYRGLMTPLFGSMLELSTLMTSYGYVKRLLSPIDRTSHTTQCGLASDIVWWKRILASGVAGICVSTVLTPVELVKCRLQIENLKPISQATRLKGPFMYAFSSRISNILFKCIIMKEDGIRGFFRGNVSTIMREVPGNIAYFGVYEIVCDFFRRRKYKRNDCPPNPKSNLHPLAYITAGASAGVAYWTAFFPADVVKSRIQTGHLKNSNPNPTFYSVLRHIYLTEGFRGLYKGWGITVLRAAPSNAAVFFAYEMGLRGLSSL
eukprot:GSMAST32.ASY1.ANO1.2083.1 assembled CDS